MSGRMIVDSSTGGQIIGRDCINRGGVKFYNGDIVINLVLLTAPLTAEIHGGNNVLGNHGDVRMQIEDAIGGQNLNQVIAELIGRSVAALPA